MDITKNLNWRVNPQHHWLLFHYSLTFFSQRNNVLPSERKVSISIVLCSPLFWPQQVSQKQIVESIALRGCPHATSTSELRAHLLIFLKLLDWH